MFRLVTHSVEKPAFLLICDNIECAFTTSAEAVISELNPVSIPQQELAFLEEARRQGWAISMRLQLCPSHHNQLKQLAAQRKPLVVPGGPQGGMSVSAE